MKITEVATNKLYEPKGTFSLALDVRQMGRLIFVSGLTSRNRDGTVHGKGDIRMQTEKVLENLRDVLEESGASMRNVVKLTIFMKDIGDLAAIKDIRAAFFAKPFPTCSTVEVSGLTDPDFLIEIEAIAAAG